MAIQQDHGAWGENLAADYLIQSGLEILSRNWRYRRAEIDIVARDQDVLVFVEVKTRAGTGFGRPEVSVDRRKQRLMVDAGMAFMRATGYESEVRFDIISIVGTPGSQFEISHFKDAFFPGLDYGAERGGGGYYNY